MNKKCKIICIAGAVLGGAMAVLFFLGYLNDTPAQILARKVLTGVAFIIIGIGFVFHKEKSWKILGCVSIVVNALVIFFWVSVMRDFM